VVALRGRAVDEAQGHRAEAERALLDAQAVAREARARWLDESEAHARGESLSHGLALAEADAWRRTLELRATRAEAQAESARGALERAQEALLDARSKHRQVERWRAQLQATLDAEEARRTRVATDEAAARAVESAR
jgi:hypothetical protein